MMATAEMEAAMAIFGAQEDAGTGKTPAGMMSAGEKRRCRPSPRASCFHLEA